VAAKGLKVTGFSVSCRETVRVAEKGVSGAGDDKLSRKRSEDRKKRLD
jgi:hypothetical protein